MTTDVLNDALRQNYMLVDARATAWTASKTDREASDKLAGATGADERALNTTKKLLKAGNNDVEWKAVDRVIQSFRKEHRRLTTAFNEITGQRLLRNEMIMEYLKMVKVHKASLDSALDDLVSVYPERRDAALEHLGDVANPEDYPSAEEIRGMYSIEYNLTKASTATDMVTSLGMGDNVRNALSRHINSAVERSFAAALSESLERLAAPIRHLVERLNGNAKRWVASTVQAPRDEADILIRATANPELKELCQSIIDDYDSYIGVSYIKDNKAAAKVVFEGYLSRINALQPV